MRVSRFTVYVYVGTLRDSDNDNDNDDRVSLSFPFLRDAINVLRTFRIKLVEASEGRNYSNASFEVVGRLLPRVRLRDSIDFLKAILELSAIDCLLFFSKWERQRHARTFYVSLGSGDPSRFSRLGEISA